MMTMMTKAMEMLMMIMVMQIVIMMIEMMITLVVVVFDDLLPVKERTKICNILALHSQGLSTDQYKTVMRVVEMAILSTDLARWGS